MAPAAALTREEPAIWAVNADDEYHEDSGDRAGELTAPARALAGTHPLGPREIGVECRDRRRF